jgi:hypothetical protein
MGTVNRTIISNEPNLNMGITLLPLERRWSSLHDSLVQFGFLRVFADFISFSGRRHIGFRHNVANGKDSRRGREHAVGRTGVAVVFSSRLYEDSFWPGCRRPGAASAMRRVVSAEFGQGSVGRIGQFFRTALPSAHRDSIQGPGAEARFGQSV